MTTHRTSAHLREENFIARAVVSRMEGVESFQYRDRQELNFSFHDADGDIVFMAAITNRNIMFNQYDTVMCNGSRADTAALSPYPCYLIIGWKDTLGYIEDMANPDERRMGGRYDRGGPHDIEEMAYYNRSRVIVLARRNPQ